MTSNHQIASGQLIDLNTQVVGMARSTRRAVLVDQEPRPATAPYRRPCDRSTAGHQQRTT